MYSTVILIFLVCVLSFMHAGKKFNSCVGNHVCNMTDILDITHPLTLALIFTLYYNTFGLHKIFNFDDVNNDALFM